MVPTDDLTSVTVTKGLNYRNVTATAAADTEPMFLQIWNTQPHMENFIAVCKSRNVKDLHADIEIGAASAAMCHLANISYRLGGKKLAFDPVGMHFDSGETEANKMLTRAYRKPYVVAALA